MSSSSQQQTQVRAHGSDVGSGFTADPEDSESLFRVVLNQFTFVNSPDSQVSLHC